MTIARPAECISSWAPVNMGALLAQTTPAKEAERFQQLQQLVAFSCEYLEEFELRCLCGSLADSLHFLPSFGVAKDGEPITVVAACGASDPGGYWFRLNRFWDDPAGWGLHLAGKSRPGWEGLVEWLLEQQARPDRLIPAESFQRVVHAGRLLFAVGGPSGARGERDLLVMDAVHRRELYRGKIDISWPQARASLARLLGQPDVAAVMRRAAGGLRRRHLTAADVDRIADELETADRDTRWLELVNDGCNAIAGLEAPTRSRGILLPERDQP